MALNACPGLKCLQPTQRWRLFCRGHGQFSWCNNRISPYMGVDESRMHGASLPPASPLSVGVSRTAVLAKLDQLNSLLHDGWPGCMPQCYYTWSSSQRGTLCA